MFSYFFNIICIRSRLFFLGSHNSKTNWQQSPILWGLRNDSRFDSQRSWKRHWQGQVSGIIATWSTNQQGWWKENNEFPRDSTIYICSRKKFNSFIGIGHYLYPEEMRIPGRISVEICGSKTQSMIELMKSVKHGLPSNPNPQIILVLALHLPSMIDDRSSSSLSHGESIDHRFKMCSQLDGQSWRFLVNVLSNPSMHRFSRRKQAQLRCVQLHLSTEHMPFNRATVLRCPQADWFNRIDLSITIHCSFR